MVPDAVFVLWPGVAAHWPALEAAIRRHWGSTVVEDVDAGTAAGLHALLLDIYMRKDAALAPATRQMFLDVIGEKARVMAGQGLAFRVAACRLPPDGAGMADPGARAEALKAELRAAAPCAVRKPYKLNLNVHASDGRWEAGLLADTLLSPVSRAHLALRPAPAPSVATLDRIHALRTWCRETGTDTRAVCAVGGAVLEACGLRKARDLDVIVHPAVLQPGWAGGVKEAGHGLDIAVAGYHWTASGPGVDDAALVDHPALHFNVCGIKHAALPLVIETKRERGRVKDARDAAIVYGGETARLSGPILAAMRAAGAPLPG